MFNIERWQEIFEAISKNKLRTILTGLSVSSGIFILIILLGVADGLRKGTKKQFERDIPTKIRFQARSTEKAYKGLNPNRKIRFTPKDYQLISEKYKDEIQYESAINKKYGVRISYKDKNGAYIFFGVMPDNQFLANATLISGRFISEKDVEEKAKVVVLCTRPLKDLFNGDYKAAIGKFVAINGIEYKVIGVTEDAGGERQNTFVYTPHSTFARIYNRSNDIGRMEFTLDPREDYEEGLNRIEDFGERVKHYLYEVHNIHPDDNKGVVFYNSFTGAKKIYIMNYGMKLFFWSIGVLTLLSGIVGVSNIMLIIVKERTKEIGIRKALGAKPKAIINMILHEAIFITTISGFLGLFFSVFVLESGALSYLLDSLSPGISDTFILKPSVSFNVAIVTVILLIISGALAGYLPARHAAKIKPIIALRDE